MQKIVTYKCELCGAEYQREENAVKCEERHVIPKKIISGWYRAFNDANGNIMECYGTYPSAIRVQMEDGNVLTYQIGESETCQPSFYKGKKAEELE